MIEDILKEIVDLEGEQADRVRHSVAQAKEIVANSKMQAVQIANDTNEEIKKLSAKNIELAENAAQAQSDKIIAEANATANDILQQAEDKNKAVVNDIIGRLNTRYA